jgi:hypothetical protein
MANKLGLKLQDVTPTGSVAPWWGRFGPPLPKYPESPRGKALRDARTARGLSLREVADALGLKVERLGGLERGRYTLSEEQWATVIGEVERWQDR